MIDQGDVPDTVAAAQAAVTHGNDPVLSVGNGRTVTRRGPAGKSAQIHKTYPDDTGARTAVTQTTVRALIDAGDVGTLGVPAVKAYHPSERLLVQEHAPGRLLRDAVIDGDDDDVSTFGRAVAQLHRLPVHDATAGSFDEVLALMRPRPDELGRLRPDLATRVAELVQAAAAWHVHSDVACWVHRDLHPGQALVAGDQIWIVDWDLAGIGDPALDVGNLIAWFETHLRRRLAARCRDAFLTGYVVGGGNIPPASLRHGRAISYLRLACKRHRIGHPDGPEPMIAAAEEALN